MTPGYVIRPKADRDIDDIAEYFIAHANLDLGLTFLTELHRTPAPPKSK